MDAPRREDRRRTPEDPGRSGPGQDPEEATGEVQQKDGGQKRQAGENVEDVREKIRQTQSRQRE